MTPENHAGWIKGGASIEYKPTMTQEKDDLGHVVKEILTDEEATHSLSFVTFHPCFANAASIFFSFSASIRAA